MASLEHVNIDDARRLRIVEWRASVRAALESCASHNNISSSNCDFYEQESAVPDASSSSSASSFSSSDPNTTSARHASWRSKLSVPSIWPWLSRTSHSCGHALLLALVQPSSIAVEDGDYRDSIGALGIGSIEYQWQTWDMGIGGRI